MAKETQVGQLVIDLKIKTEALEKGLEIAKKKLREIENENKSIENSNKNLESSWVAVAKHMNKQCHHFKMFLIIQAKACQIYRILWKNTKG